ncbi:plasmid pRiA4b ORF-3 family protein [Brachybacterium vulturis]|nr:plasmid pRiA4b ORF-3 family protein [Brachybacterium vulturis]
MPAEHDDDEEIRRRFEQILAGMSTDETRAAIGALLASGPDPFRAPARPDLRRPQLSAPVVLTVRVDLRHAAPPIWRRLELRSDLSLATIHQVLQAAFSWWDYHLYRFALGGDPFDRSSQLFLCPFDVEEGEDEGLPLGEVRLDEVLQEVGDRLEYVYDYGDSWHLKLKVENVRPANEETPRAVATGGRRAAPPEDCGGLTEAEDLADVLEDPAAFDLEDLNEALADVSAAPQDLGLHPALVTLMEAARRTPADGDVAVRAAALLAPPEPLDAVEREAALRPVLWFVDRAGNGGIPLTSAGYMKPADTEAASLVLPEMASWIGKNNRESLAFPLLTFRESLQTLKLLRKYKGKLLLTRAAAAAGTEPDALWSLLASTLIPSADGFERTGAVALLLHIATTPEGQDEPYDAVAGLLTQLGWREGEGPVSRYAIRDLSVASLLRSLAPRKVSRHRDVVSAPARALAAAALAGAGEVTDE